MEMSAVSAGPNIADGMDPGMNTYIKTEYMKVNVRISIRNIKLLYSYLRKMNFSVRAVLHGECGLDSFNMVISEMKTIFLTFLQDYSTLCTVENCYSFRK